MRLRCFLAEMGLSEVEICLLPLCFHRLRREPPQYLIVRTLRALADSFNETRIRVIRQKYGRRADRCSVTHRAVVARCGTFLRRRGGGSRRRHRIDCFGNRLLAGTHGHAKQGRERVGRRHVVS